MDASQPTAGNASHPGPSVGRTSKSGKPVESFIHLSPGVESIGGRMWRLLTILGIAVLGGLGLESFAQAPDRSIRPIGEFANFRSTDKHTYKCDVELWRDGDSVIGLFFAAEGFDADMPAGMLENVRFDSRTGALSFTAKLTIAGAIDLPGLRQEPSRDLFEFSGTLKATVLSGTLKRSDLRQPLRPGSREHVQLKIRLPDGAFPTGSYAEWKRHADEILKVRGPKW